MLTYWTLNVFLSFLFSLFPSFHQHLSNPFLTSITWNNLKTSLPNPPKRSQLKNLRPPKRNQELINLGISPFSLFSIGGTKNIFIGILLLLTTINFSLVYARTDPFVHISIYVIFNFFKLFDICTYILVLLHILSTYTYNYL